MSFQHRIRTIYVKELIDILRDRRTLIAMIVVPIVLYPLLMLGSVQVVSLQSQDLQTEVVTLVTTNKQQMNIIKQWLQVDGQIAKWLRGRVGSSLGNGEAQEAQEDTPFEARVIFGEENDLTEDQIRHAIQSREAQLGVVLSVDNLNDHMTEQWRATLYADPEDIRGAVAARRFSRVLHRRDERLRLDRLDELGLSPAVVAPIVWRQERITTAGSILGLILPLILVLMTITGAIYPAIDLTAGERERGTLETLMVCPVAPIDLVVGKFMVVTTIAIMGAALNLGSVSATVYFGGFEAVIGGGSQDQFPLASLPLILLFLIPFAVLMSAIMMAVCCFARTFKEAQNYVTPVILAVLIPGGIAALPTTRLEGVMLVMPVGNMVLLTREMLVGGSVGFGNIAWVLLSTTLYAASAVAVAAKIFGSEAVVFSDSASLKNSLSRKLSRPTSRPTTSMAMLLASILFPIWFYVQSALQGAEDISAVFMGTAQLMPIFLVAVPAGLCWYFKINLRKTFALKTPALRFLAAASMVGIGGCVIVHEFSILQQRIMPIPEAILATDERLGAALAAMSPWMVLLVLAIVPAFCEELFFRGFLLGGLRGSLGKWTSIAVTALIFSAFHYFVYRLPVTAFLGVVLAFFCWQSRSIWPSVLIHVLHNGLTVGIGLWHDKIPWLHLSSSEVTAHYPLSVAIPGALLFVTGIWLAASGRRTET